MMKSILNSTIVCYFVLQVMSLVKNKILGNLEIQRLYLWIAVPALRSAIPRSGLLEAAATEE